MNVLLSDELTVLVVSGAEADHQGLARMNEMTRAHSHWFGTPALMVVMGPSEYHKDRVVHAGFETTVEDVEDLL